MNTTDPHMEDWQLYLMLNKLHTRLENSINKLCSEKVRGILHNRLSGLYGILTLEGKRKIQTFNGKEWGKALRFRIGGNENQWEEAICNAKYVESFILERTKKHNSLHYTPVTDRGINWRVYFEDILKNKKIEIIVRNQL